MQSSSSASSDGSEFRRRLPIGGEIQPQGGAHFRVWAPCSKHAWVLLYGGDETAEPCLKAKLHPEPDGYFSGMVAEAEVGTCYRFQLDNGAFPDPASRFQPEGPLGASQLVDPGCFYWTDQKWEGLAREGQVIYEMHIGTFTQEGTWTAAAAQLTE